MHQIRLMVCACLAMAAVMIPLDASAGPWTKDKGKYYAKVSELYFSSDTFVAPDGQRVAGTDYLALTSAAYFELGLLDGLQIQGFIPWSFTRNHFESTDTKFANVGLGDMIFGVQVTPFKTKLPFAFRLDAKVPLYDVAGIDGPQASSFPALGDGQVDLTLWGSFGGSFYPIPAYALAEVGYRHRTEVSFGQGTGLEYLDGVTFLGQTGYIFREKLLFALNVNGVYTFKEDLYTQSFVTVGPAVGVNVWRGFWLEANVDPMVWSRNNSPGTTISLGISHKN